MLKLWGSMHVCLRTWQSSSYPQHQHLITSKVLASLQQTRVANQAANHPMVLLSCGNRTHDHLDPESDALPSELKRFLLTVLKWPFWAILRGLPKPKPTLGWRHSYYWDSSALAWSHDEAMKNQTKRDEPTSPLWANDVRMMSLSNMTFPKHPHDVQDNLIPNSFGWG